MSRYSRRRRTLDLARIVDLHQRGKITRERAAELAYLAAEQAAASVPGAKEYDFDNARRVIDLIVEKPVEEWLADFSFWAISVQFDAPWVQYRHPHEVN